MQTFEPETPPKKLDRHPLALGWNALAAEAHQAQLPTHTRKDLSRPGQILRPKPPSTKVHATSSQSDYIQYLQHLAITLDLVATAWARPPSMTQSQAQFSMHAHFAEMLLGVAECFYLGSRHASELLELADTMRSHRYALQKRSVPPNPAHNSWSPFASFWLAFIAIAQESILHDTLRAPGQGNPI